MDPRYPRPLPHDEYALSMLTQAAMSQNPDSSNQQSNYLNRPNLSRQPPDISSTTSITNHSTHNPRPPHSQTPVHNSFVPSSGSMETLSFTSGQMRQHLYMSTGLPDPASHMPPSFPNHLGILNAESYDPYGTRDNKATPTQDRLLPFGITDAPESRPDLDVKTASDDIEKGSKRRKKHKIEPENVDEDEEARKKARGRPRVDTKDETAADRRRTQIRMAQRAYRHRKETTISSLEKKVQDLRGTNEEMSNIFINLYDFAVGRGLLEREPEFGQHLQSTTERFLALAKSTAHDEGSQDEQQEEAAKPAESEPPKRTAKVVRASARKLQESPVVSQAPVQPYGGYMGRMSPSESPVEEISPDTQMQTFEHRPRQHELQIITQPTEDNASFPFEYMDLQQYRVDVPPMEDYLQNFLQPQLNSQLPLPSTHSHGEFSFARRIQRLSIERAYRLITSENPPEQRFREVFGLTLTYETRENMIAKIKRQLAKSDKETLHEWRNPFVHIGGSGTFYPNYDSQIEADLMPKFRTGYSMGPFNSMVGQAQELMQDDMRCNMPGFEGEFFDANDVEGYLRGRGLNIPATADYVTAELDSSILNEVMTPRSESLDTLPTIPSPKTPTGPPDTTTISDVSQPSGYNKNANDCKGFPFPITLWSMDNSKDTSNIDPIFKTLSDQTGLDRSSQAMINNKSSPDKCLVTINVEVLLEGILSRSVCLGRNAGYRLSDVNAAIVAAVKAGY